MSVNEELLRFPDEGTSRTDRSICASSCVSVMLQRTLIALDLYKSVLLFMSFIKELVMMMTSSAEGHTSLITKYTIRLRLASLF